MDQDEVVLEEGELSDDSDTYTPLARPSNYSSTQPNTRFPTVQYSDSEIEIQSTDSDSDSDNNQKLKKPKIKLKPKLQQQTEPKRKKYDIWSTRAQEDALSETLNSCDVTLKDRSREVESYDVLGNHFYKRANKRSSDDRKNSNLRSVGRANSGERAKGSSRLIRDLIDTETATSEEIAKDMANKLCEDKEDLLLRVVNTLGVKRSVSIYNETKKIEEDGGMLIMNQTRRRTPGGVFLFLIRHDNDITPEQKEKIFEEEKNKSKVMIRNKQKKKLKKLKDSIKSSRNKLLPELLTRADLLTNESNRERKETDERDVINPPPTPETDQHENSGDGSNTDPDNERRKLNTYDDDFLDLGCSNEMDLF